MTQEINEAGSAVDTIEPAPSQLGTKEYWDNVYETEVTNFEDYGDHGEVWFGEESAEKMVDWVVENYGTKKDIPVIDIGCGNGHLLFELRNNGFTDLTGVDYSEKAIELAHRISQENQYDEPSDAQDETLPSIVFKRLDVLDDDDIACRKVTSTESMQPSHAHDTMRRASHESAYGIALDKGTFDAISLANPQSKSDVLNHECQHPADKYVTAVASMLAPGGRLLLTSCNWTEAELSQRFNPAFDVVGRIPHPVFKFGGVTGQTITTVVFRVRKK